MVYSTKLYYSDKVNNIDQIKNNINENNHVDGVYLICVNLESNNLFNIMTCYEIYKEYNIIDNYVVVGIAKGKKDAFLLMQKIFNDYYMEHKKVDLIKNSFVEG